MFIIGLFLALAITIICLSTLSSLIQQWYSDYRKEKDAHRSPDTKYGRYEIGTGDKVTVVASIDSIANELNSYKQQQERNESSRALREKIIIVVGVIAAGFAGGSAWIFQGQLNEMRTGERAFLDVEQLKVDQIAEFPPDRLTPQEDIVWQLSPIFENSGKTPAVNIKVVAVTPTTAPSFYGVTQGETVPGTHMHPISNRDLARNAPDDPDVIYSWPAAKMQDFLVKDFTYLGPNKATIPPQAVFPEWRVRQFQAWPWWFYSGSIHYEDFFGEPHISKFCFQIDPAALGGLGKPKYWVGITACAHWNCMDDSCKKDRAEFDAENTGTQESRKR
jgi:hypothetical protein